MKTDIKQMVITTLRKANAERKKNNQIARLLRLSDIPEEELLRERKNLSEKDKMEMTQALTELARTLSIIHHT